MLVLLAAVVRWLPAPQGRGSLGRGDAWIPLRISTRIRDSSVEPDRSIAGLRGGFSAQGTARQYRWLQLVRQIETRTPPDATVQLKGLSRNEGWILAYDLYPRRVVGEASEFGGAVGDPTLAGVAAVLIGTERATDLPQVHWVTP